MLHYVVTEGRTRVLDQARMLDRSTYGQDWIVVPAITARDAVRQWRLFKAGTHPRQGQLELEAVRHRTALPDFAPSREAESAIVASDVERTLESVEAERDELDELRGRLQALRQDLLGRSRPRRRRPSSTRRRRAA